jgi:hypothetical protein
MQRNLPKGQCKSKDAAVRLIVGQCNGAAVGCDDRAADAARVEQEPEQTDGNKDGGKPPVQLKTKDDIKNYLKGIM